MPDITHGTRLAFCSKRGIIAATYPDIRKGVVVGQGQDPGLSPDGKFVAFEDTSGAGERRFVICDAQTRHRIGAHPGVMPRFSPDGKQICFSRDFRDKWTAFVIDAALRSPARSLATLATAAEPPAWASHWTKDGLVVAYSETLGGALYALRPDGAVVRKFVIKKLPGAPETLIPMGCALSDDLTRLLFEGLTGESTKKVSDDGEPLIGLFLFETGANRVRQISPKGLGATNPVWYDQGTFLFAGAPNRPGAETAIYAQSLAGGGAQLLVPGASDFTIARTPKG